MPSRTGRRGGAAASLRAVTAVRPIPIRSARRRVGAAVLAFAAVSACAFFSSSVCSRAAWAAEATADATDADAIDARAEARSDTDTDVEARSEALDETGAARVPEHELGPAEAARVRVRRLRRLGDSGGFPPIGMRLDLPQAKGHWTFSYRYVHVKQEGLGDDRESVDPTSILGSPYTEVPTKQTSELHVVGVAYAPLDRLTFELSLPYAHLRQSLLNASGSEQTSSSGIGDARFVFIVPFIANGDQSTDLTLGFTFPTGGIEQNDRDGDRLPYSMQLGSGTWDLVWGITYTGREGRLGWGGEIDGVYRIGDNVLGYTQGTVYEASAWLTAMLHEWVTLTGRVGWSRRTNVGGADPALDPAASPANDPMKQGWNRLDLGPGANVFLPVLGGQRLAVEAMFPVLQVLSGPQLQRDWILTAGFQWLY